MTKYSPEIVDELNRLISGGVPDKYACDAVGINRDTFYDWLKKKPGFSDIITRARGRFVASHVGNIQKAAGGWPAEYDDAGNLIREEQEPDPKHSEWLLERRAPEEFSQNINARITGGEELDEGKDIYDKVIATDPDAKAAALQLLRSYEAMGGSVEN